MIGKKSKIFYPAAYFMTGVICFMAQWCVFRGCVFPDHPSIAGSIYKGVAEGGLLLCWYWLLAPRYRWWLQVPVWISGLLFFANLLYFRVFADIIPVGAVMMTGNFNPLFFKSGLALFKASDSLLLIIPLCFSALYFCFFRKRVRDERLTAKEQWIAIAICLVLWLGQQAIYIRSHKHSPEVVSAMEVDPGKGLTWGDAVLYQYVVPNFLNRAGDLHDRGLVVYTVREIYRTLTVSDRPITLSSEQIKGIDSYLESLPKGYSLPAEFADRDGKNVILIIVESLNSWVFDMKVGGEEVTPCLNRILKDSTTFSVLDVIPETRHGGSSDGQLIYDTGLLPLSHGAAVMSFPTQKYPSMASTLDREVSLQFIGDNRKVWNYGSSTLQYGYDRLYDETDIAAAGIDRDAMGKDVAIFTFAADVLTKGKRPFYAEIITLSMHLPFREDAVERIAAFDGSDHSQTFKDYITAVRFFDTQLCRFMERLQQEGIYDDTIIFLASDHGIVVFDEGHENTLKDGISFIGIHAGGRPSNIYGEVRQSDIFPTMLDIAGRGNSPWKGLGVSVFAEEYRRLGLRPSSASTRQTTDLLIKGNYFKQ